MKIINDINIIVNFEKLLKTLLSVGLFSHCYHSQPFLLELFPAVCSSLLLALLFYRGRTYPQARRWGVEVSGRKQQSRFMTWINNLTSLSFSFFEKCGVYSCLPYRGVCGTEFDKVKEFSNIGPTTLHNY